MAEEDKCIGMHNVYGQVDELTDLINVINSVVMNINTAIPVKVVATYAPRGAGNAVGYVDVLPLIAFVDANGNTVDQTTLYHLPYFRLQGGVVAIVADPMPDDIGLAVFAQRDGTNVVVGTKQCVRPGSFRNHSMSDGWYIGGFVNQAPTCFLELNQNNTATLTAQNGTTINVQSGGLTINGDVKVNGRIDATSDITAGGNKVTVLGHIHVGVHGNTTPPVEGT